MKNTLEGRGFSLFGVISLVVVGSIASHAIERPGRDGKIDLAKLIELHNKVRKEADLPPLKANPKLEEAAKLHAKDMADRGKMTHDGGDGSTPAQRVERAGYKYRNTGENVALGQKSSADVLKAWMDSPPHKKNILGDFSEIGVACFVDPDGAPYWCVEFGLPWPEIDPEAGAEDLIKALNKARADAKLPALTAHVRLTDPASRHAKANAEAEKFLEEDPDGVAPTDRVREGGYKAKSLAQADGAGQSSAEEVVKGWVGRDDTKKVVLGDFKYVGVGVARSKDGVPYWTAIFAAPPPR